VDVLEVSVAEYEACVEDGDCTVPLQGGYCNWGVNGTEDDPINCVSEFQADAYCAWVEKRLPTEWEWEWAARGRDEARKYPWGDTEPTMAVSACYANNTGTCIRGAHPQDTSRDGLKDLAGNVKEWTSSNDGTFDYLRGGGFSFIQAGDLTTYARYQAAASLQYNFFGVRCVVEVESAP
jgi:formylglycine-generating enzyme required for sulfatase activity